MEYFGLEHWQPNEKDSRTHQWINLRNRLSQDSGSGNSIQLMLALRVKFWVPVHLILQESVRNIFYMQAKVDLIEGRLNAKDWNNAAKLSALLCQADGIRFNESCLTAKYPIRIKQQQQHDNNNNSKDNKDNKEKKEKEPVLAFKKRRLSKQKSIESFDLPTLPLPQSTDTSSLSSNSHNSHHHPSTSSSNCSVTTNSNYHHHHHHDTETISPLQVYEDYIIRPNDSTTEMPEEFLRQIAQEHGKLAKIKMPQKSAKYWLLKEIQDLPGFGEEVFSGVTANESSVRCDVSVGAHGLIVCTGDEKYK